MFAKYENGAEVEITEVYRYADGTEQGAEAVYKYVDGAEEAVWTSFPADYVMYEGELADGCTVSRSWSETCTSYTESDPSVGGNASGSSNYLSIYPSGSYSNTITANVIFTIDEGLSDYSYIYIEAKSEPMDAGYSSHGPESSHSFKITRSSGSSFFTPSTTEELDDGYIRYKFKRSTSYGFGNKIYLVMTCTYETYVYNKPFSHSSYIRNIWGEE